MKEKIKKILANLTSSDCEITPKTHLVIDLYFDSLDIAEVCVAIEEAFCVELCFESIITWNTVGDIYVHVESLLKG